MAIEALIAAESGARANVELARLLANSGLEQRDRAFATELAYGTIRMCRACDWLIDRFARGELEPSVRAAARAGVYQLVFMRVPPYAAVSATLDESVLRARPLLNAVLRKVAALVEAGPVQWPTMATRLSYPDWVVARLVTDLGEDRAVAALKQMNEAASVHLRPDGYAQDPGSQLVGEYALSLLGPLATGPVLDVCASPGGKATLLARSGRLVVASDGAPERARIVSENAARLVLGNVAVLTADGRRAPFRDGTFSAVLVDAPCSGLGVLRRRPDARWRTRPDDVARLANLQKLLLGAAAPLVAPGGLLVYSVCTLTAAETAEIDAWAVTQARSWPGRWEAFPAPGLPWEPLGRGALLLPQAAGTDGMYVLALERAPSTGTGTVA